MLSPVVLFVYNRPVHTQKVLEHLMQNELAAESTLYIYADGCKQHATTDEIKCVEEVRYLIRQKQWCGEVVIIESSINKGLANSIIDGVTEIINKHGRIIVLEDDLITSIGFLKFMNDALNMYENEEKVMGVSAYMFPVKKKLPETYFLLGGGSTWGWATWQRAWKHFNPDSRELYNSIACSRKLVHKFNFDNTADYIGMLKNNADGKNDSWGIRWYASVFLLNGLGLWINKSLVKNIGMDSSGVHCTTTDIFDIDDIAAYINVERIPVKENNYARKQIADYYVSVTATNKGLKKFVTKAIRLFSTYTLRHGRKN